MGPMAGDPNRKVRILWYTCMYLCMQSLCFGTNGVSCDRERQWLRMVVPYYHTRYVGEAKRVGFDGNTDIFGGVKEQLCEAVCTYLMA